MSLLGFDELLQKLRTSDESVEIEAKRAEEFGNRILETVSAFSNEPGRNGGYLILGVATAKDALFPVYEIYGVPKPDQLQADLATKCRDTFNVPVRPQIITEIRNNKTVIVAYIPEAQAHEKPVFIKSRNLPLGAFRRIGSTSQHCTEEDIALFYQLRDHRTYDETAIPGTSMADFDPDAIAEYRRARGSVNPSAAELKLSDAELMYSLAATTNHQGQTCATVAGLMLFGKAAALRRYFPMARVDYILVEGREWVPDPDHRYQTIEMLEPLVSLIPRVVSHVLSDIPKAFALTSDQLRRQDVPTIPRTVIREVIVNALMHRSYRMRQPVQIIRYSNRLEIRNPGHSLIPDDRLGEPGSVTRNEKIAAVLHETGLAETKGTGVRAMREAMTRVNMTLPLFESDRQKDNFTVTLLTHHLSSPEIQQWLAQFKTCRLTEDEARALLFVREVGAINNAAYRDINRLDTLTASGHLRRLRDLDLLEQKGKGATTYYVSGKRLLAAKGGPAPSTTDKPLSVEPSTLDKALSRELADLPKELADATRALGRRNKPENVRRAIRQLCAWKPLRAVQLAEVLGRDQIYLSNNYLNPLVRSGELEYTHPETPEHPQQAYRTTAKGKKHLHV